MCNTFAKEHPEWDITFVYGVADEATAADQVAQDPEVSADVFMYANDRITSLTDATWARVTVIIINVWVGVPYTLLQLTGVLQNIPEELYEAAKVDGANAFQTFTKITLPYMLYVTTP